MIKWVSTDSPKKEEIKMAKYRVVVTETITYEVYVEAKDQIKAEDIALETYGYNGEISDTEAEVTEIEEEE